MTTVGGEIAPALTYGQPCCRQVSFIIILDHLEEIGVELGVDLKAPCKTRNWKLVGT